MSSDTKNTILGGDIYLVEHDGDWRLVHKVSIADGEEKQIYEVDPDGRCSCPAGEHGRECKHVRMAFNELGGPDTPKGQARRTLETWLDKAREECPGAKFSNLVRFKKSETVEVATAIATNFEVGCKAPRFTLWTEIDGLLIRIHVFDDPARYRRALSAARRAK